MNSKLIATLAVAMLAFAGVGAILDDGASDADPTPEAKYLTIMYAGIIDPADMATMGVTPASANYVAELVNEPVTYKDGLKFDLIKTYLNVDKFVVPMATAAAWNPTEKASIMDAFAEFAGPVTTEVKFVADANKTVYIANLADVETELETALAIVEAMYDLEIEGLNATITEKNAIIAEKNAIIEALEAEPKGDAQTWQIVSLVLGALFVLMAIFGGRAIVLIRKSGGRLF